MTRRTVFGDFLDLARRQLDATPGTIRAAGGEDVQRACDSVARLAGVLARYVRDITPPGATPSRSGTSTSTGTGWDRARAEAQHALATMRAILHENDPRVRQKRPMSGPPDTLAHRLDAAALSLTAGRDLLQSHLAVAADGTRQYRTEWGLAITSPGAARAMLIELASICRQAGAQGTQVALTPGWRGSPQARRRLATACQWALILDAAVRTADRREPASAAHREELARIPSSVLPASRLPEANESIADLCQGIQRDGRATAPRIMVSRPGRSLVAMVHRQIAADCGGRQHRHLPPQSDGPPRTRRWRHDRRALGGNARRCRRRCRCPQGVADHGTRS